MASRLELQSELENFSPNVYFQQPSNINILYPCIIYGKNDKDQKFGNDGVYLSKQGYQITVIEYDPDSSVANNIESHFTSCVISQYYTVDNLNHTTLNLYY